MEFSEKEIREIMTAFSEQELSELVIETAAGKLICRKGMTGEQPAQCGKSAQSLADVTTGKKAAVSQSADGQNAAATGEAGQKEMTEDEQELAVRAPLVGTFYNAAKPGDAPFVTEGQTVAQGDVLGIIEAMKMMNEITAPAAGEVTKVLAQDGTFVQFDAELFRIRKKDGAERV